MQLLRLELLRAGLNNSDVDKAQLAENIRTGRARLNLTRVQFAKKARITTNTLRTLENGAHSRLPDTDTLQKVAKALKTTTEALFGGKLPLQPDNPVLKGLNEEDLQTARMYHDANTDVRLHVSNVLRSSAIDKSAELVARLMRLSPARRSELEALLASSERVERDTAIASAKTADQK